MWVIVRFTHHAGIKLPKGAAHPRGEVQGELGSSLVSGRHWLTVRYNVHNGPDLAQLAQVRLVGILGNVIRVAGLERRATEAGVMWVHQEWICQLVDRPKGLPGPGMSHPGPTGLPVP